MQVVLCKSAVVLVAIIFDFITGLVKSFVKQNFTSARMREGLYHKTGEIMALALMYFLQYSLPMYGINVQIPLVETISIYIMLMELASIIENIGIINPQLTGALGNIFEKINAVKGENDNEKRN